MANENPGYAVNGNSSLIALSNDGLRQPVTLWADPVTHALITSGGSGGGGTQYPTGQVVTTPTGTLALGYDGTAVRALKTDTSGNLQTDIRDTLGNPISAFPATFLRTSDEPHQVFYDPFDSTLDVTNRWTSTQGSSGVAALNTTGQMAMGTGTVANGYSKLTSQPSFTLPIPAWLGVSDAITIPDLAAPTANAYRFWGVGTTPGTPTATAPITDGVGFELSTAGKMFAVVYAGGTRTAIQDLSTSGNSTQPTDANQHRYIVYIRTDKAYWYIDGITSAQLVATSNFQAPQVQTLPKLFLAVGGSTPPGSNSQIMCNGATAWDTGKNANQLADGTFPWRKATINSSGALGIVNSELADITGTITNATQTTPVVASGLTGYDNVLVSINGTYNTATAIFQGSDDAGTTWYNISTAARSDSPTIEAGYTALTNITRAWNINIQGYDSFRVNPSAVASGTVNVRISPESAPSTAGATVTANISNGTNTADVVAGDTGQNGLITAGGRKEFAGLSTAATSGNFLLPATDVSAYKFISLQLQGGTWTGTIVMEASNDNTNWNAYNLANNGVLNSAYTSNVTNLLIAPVMSRYVRIRVSVTGTGTVQGTVELFTVPPALTQLTAIVSSNVGVTQVTSPWVVGSNSATGSAVPANAFAIGGTLGGNLTIPTINNGNSDAVPASNALQVSANAYLWDGTQYVRQRSATAAAGTTGTGLLGVGNLAFDGTNWQAFRTANNDNFAANIVPMVVQGMVRDGTGAGVDRARMNTTAAVIAAGATASNAGVSVTTYNASKAVIIVNVTAITGTLTVTINAITASGYSYPILVSTAIATTGTTPLRIGEGLTASANAVANDILPRTIQVVTAVTGTATYGVDNELSV